ncbi:hypothetical protein [Limnoglobus roseus]|uniref:Uncharacterized protein n=1 Tax=Limnoglobus roseus TaxID=2598579 RepID=A0A5C1AR18_9BACT|nr:hypothetical protein [Limnoglobus roseus]QEL21065.1 hypothetical protein PX52LOC_08194 [Limnoglobus roseus]
MIRRIAFLNVLLISFFAYVTLAMNARPPVVELLNVDGGSLSVQRSSVGWPFPKHRETYERPKGEVTLDRLGESSEELADRFKSSLRIESHIADGLNVGFYVALALSLLLNVYLVLRPQISIETEWASNHQSTTLET